ncbi:hypothetical protein CRG98_009931 [Punica granatum]|uniref:Uncharacterized protein n=1 Tax=Punica granatum TaxID=22663 RepID=A0A2I0KMU7_PUNGR|nr:hypothetical protein CRG98_009931 [Punica granatum]
MINANEISFNEVKPPNVRANPLPDHGSSSRPTINMISVCAIREEEKVQATSVSFVIEYVPVEIAVASTPFVIEVPAREPYQGNRVPWNYGDNVANMEQDMSVMAITRSSWVYEDLELATKGKARACCIPNHPRGCITSCKGHRRRSRSLHESH